MSEPFAMRLAYLEADMARALWERLLVWAPNDPYGLLRGGRVDSLEPTRSGDYYGYASDHGVCGGPEEIDLDFEVKKGGPWAAWFTSKSRRRYIAFKPGAPVADLLRHMTITDRFFLAFDSRWTELRRNCFDAGFDQVKFASTFEVWSPPDQDFTASLITT